MDFGNGRTVFTKEIDGKTYKVAGLRTKFGTDDVIRISKLQ